MIWCSIRRVGKPAPDAASLIKFRKAAARSLPSPIGVYALCDLDGTPMYVGQSTDGLRARINRHITSARSDIIANRTIDVWEVAYVTCWQVDDAAQLNPLEAHLFHEFDAKSQLMNGTVPAKPKQKVGFKVQKPETIQILPNEEIASRKRVTLRLTRQAKHFGDLLDYFLVVKDSSKVFRSLQAHFERLQRYFAGLGGDPDADVDE